MVSPGLQGRALFRCEIMALVDADNARPAAGYAATKARKDQVAKPWGAPQQVLGGLRRWNDMGRAILGSAGWDRPDRMIIRDLAPGHAGHRPVAGILADLG